MPFPHSISSKEATVLNTLLIILTHFFTFLLHHTVYLFKFHRKIYISHWKMLIFFTLNSTFDICGGGLVTKSCPILMTPWTIALQAHLSLGIPQARILEWVAISFSRGSSQLRNWTCLFCTADEFFTAEPLRKPLRYSIMLIYVAVIYPLDQDLQKWCNGSQDDGHWDLSPNFSVTKMLL